MKKPNCFLVNDSAYENKDSPVIADGLYGHITPLPFCATGDALCNEWFCHAGIL